MIAPDLGITRYTDRYLLGRNVSPEYANTLRQRIESFCCWAGSDVSIASLDCELANGWLADLAARGLSAWSLRGYRGALLTIWVDAFQSGANHNPPLRLRKIRRPCVVVQAYTHDEIRALLTATERLSEIHSDGNSAAHFWRAAIHVGYCCGPRRGDLLALEWRHVSPQGVLVFIQHKTGFPNMVQLSDETLRACRLLHGDGRLLPWPYTHDWFSRCFTQLRGAAGVTRGSFKWIRRSAGSYAERDHPGAGARLLGHRDPAVFRAFYDDPTISQSEPAMPPALRRQAGAE